MEDCLHFNHSFRLHRKNHPMLKLNPTNPLGSLNKSNTSTNKFRICCRIPVPSTRNAMIKTTCHTSFRWDIKVGCTYKKSALQNPIRRFIHSMIDLTPSPNMWVKMILISTFRSSLVCSQHLMWTSFGHTFHLYWTP
jgi:hypothetical protein